VHLFLLFLCDILMLPLEFCVSLNKEKVCTEHCEGWAVLQKVWLVWICPSWFRSSFFHRTRSFLSKSYSSILKPNSSWTRKKSNSGQWHSREGDKWRHAPRGAGLGAHQYTLNNSTNQG